jgi:hypothetical protein
VLGRREQPSIYLLRDLRKLSRKTKINAVQRRMPQSALSGIGVGTADLLFATGWYVVPSSALIGTFWSVPSRVVWM